LAAVFFWLMAGPVSLVQAARFAALGRETGARLRVLLLPPAMGWAFCLGVVVLEGSYRLIYG
jgi:hypothetical protein